MQYLATGVVIAVLLASVYFGFSNAKDIVDTITVWQRLVGITATAYAITAVVALYGLWRRRHWLARCLEVWAVLVVFTAALAAVVYGQTRWSTILVMLVAALIVGPVVVYGRRHSRTVSHPGARP
jgi:peptidoglycan/LPS O-acetylase OafA/YrhL